MKQVLLNRWYKLCGIVIVGAETTKDVNKTFKEVQAPLLTKALVYTVYLIAMFYALTVKLFTK